MCFQSIMCVRSDEYVLDIVEMCVRVVRCVRLLCACMWL